MTVSSQVHRGRKLLKNPGDLTERQTETLKGIKQTGGVLYRTSEMKQPLAGYLCAGDLTTREVSELIGHECNRASRSRIESFTRLSKTIRTHKEGTVASIEFEISHKRVEGSRTDIRSINSRCYGLHSAEVTLALVMVTCGPIDLQLQYGRENSST